MTTTAYTTWTQMFRNETWEQAYDIDPYNELELDEGEREVFLGNCRRALEAHVDELLEPYGATILGNGEIVGPVENAAAFHEALEDEYGLREALGDYDFQF